MSDTSITPVLSVSVTCDKCNTVHKEEQGDPAKYNPTQYKADRRVEGWLIPDAIENKPVLCPKCRQLLIPAQSRNIP